MAVEDFDRALTGTDQTLDAAGVSREWVHEFFVNHTEPGQAIRMTGGYGSEADHAWDDELFIEVMVVAIQRLVYGDVGDEQLDAPVMEAPEADVDGHLGTWTLKRMETWTEWEEDAGDLLIDRVDGLEAHDYILFDGERIPIPGVQIVTFDQDAGLDLRAGSRRDERGRKLGSSKWPKPVSELIGASSKYARLLGFLHWDAGWSAAGRDRDGDGFGDGGGAFGTLIKRGLGTCIGIDRPRKSDGQVIGYQWLDPGKYYGWHGGGSANRAALMSFDLSNAVYRRYHERYIELCGIPRPRLRVTGREVVGAGNVFLGMYRDQIVMTLRILKALSTHVGLPLIFPTNDDGTPMGRNYKRLFKDDYFGVATHRHLPRTRKWDIRGFEAQIIALLLSDADLMTEFPELEECFRLADTDIWGPWFDKVGESWAWEELWS